MAYPILKKLVVKGASSGAEIAFSRGFNLIVGPTDTGKSFILELIDFMLGSDQELRDIDQVKKYQRVFLEIENSNGKPTTFSRALSGGEYSIYESRYSSNISQIAAEKKSTTNFRKYLNQVFGFDGVKLRKNSEDSLVSLSTRQARDYFILEEDRIISKKSGLISSQYTEKTIYRSMFKYFLTGEHHAHLSKPKQQKLKDAENAAKRETLVRLKARLDRKIDGLAKNLPEGLDLAALRDELKRKTAEKLKVDSTYSKSLSEKLRLSKELGDLSQKISEMKEDLQRFAILKKHYISDLERLEFIYESVDLTSQLPPFHCPYCGSEIDKAKGNHSRSCGPNDEDLRDGVSIEIAKIKKSQSELVETVTFIKAELENSLEKQRSKRDLERDLGKEIEAEIIPIVKSIDKEIAELTKVRERITLHNTYREEMEHIESLVEHYGLDPIDQEKESDDSSDFPTEEAQRLCDEISAILKKWNFRGEHSVTFDSTDRDNYDITIGTKKRSEFGKGSRAIYLFATYLALLKYCRQEKRQFSGFLVVDSPINPFKGKEIEDPENGRISNIEEENIFRGLSTLEQEYQVIMLENKYPSEEVRALINYVEFTDDPARGRQGFL